MNKSRFFAIFTVLIWATNPAVVKSMLGEIPNMQALSAGSFMAFLFLLGVNLKKGTLRDAKKYAPRQYGCMALLGFTGMFLYNALYYFGLTQLTSQEACIINYLGPLMLVLFSCLLLKEKLTMMKIVAMLCSFAGIVILSSGGGASAAEGSRWPGVLCCIIAAACYGLFSVLNKKADFDQNIAMPVMWLTTALCSLVFGLLTESWVPLSGMQWLGMLWLGAIISGAAYLTWALALKEAENTAAVANLAYLTPFLALIISAVFLGEGLHPRAVIALIFIVVGILPQSFFDQKRA